MELSFCSISLSCLASVNFCQGLQIFKSKRTDMPVLMHVILYYNVHKSSYLVSQTDKVNDTWFLSGCKGGSRIHSSSGFSAKLECKAFPTLSTIAEVVMEDSMHKIAVMASS